MCQYLIILVYFEWLVEVLDEIKKSVVMSSIE